VEIVFFVGLLNAHLILHFCLLMPGHEYMFMFRVFAPAERTFRFILLLAFTHLLNTLKHT
jgi:hypothetical protein